MWPRIYVTSKVKHGPMWQELAGQHPIKANWIYVSEYPASEIDWPVLWSICVKQASECSSLVAYVEPGEILKGGLVEIGCALAHGKPVFYVGPNNQTVYRHNLVEICPTLDDALEKAGNHIA